MSSAGYVIKLHFEEEIKKKRKRNELKQEQKWYLSMLPDYVPDHALTYQLSTNEQCCAV